MDDSLKEIHEILNELESDLAHVRAIWRGIEKLNPDFEQVSEENWQEKHARMWLHGATKVHECNELERWLFDSPPLTATTESPAQPHYDYWRGWLDNGGKWEGSAHYIDDPNFDILAPLKNEILIQYIVRLAQTIEKKGKGKKLQWRALKCFLHFLRENNTDSEVAFIEHIFPKQMDVFYSRIIRLLPDERYPISERTASEIIINLAYRCRNEIRKDAQITAAESLGLCWLCIAASRLRLPMHLEVVMEIKPTAIQFGADFPILQVPTWFGNRPVNISSRLARFLSAIARIPSSKSRETILQRPPRSLTRVFETVLKSIAPNPEYGNITHASLLSQPHIFGDHRPQPKRLSSS